MQNVLGMGNEGVVLDSLNMPGLKNIKYFWHFLEENNLLWNGSTSRENTIGEQEATYKVEKGSLIFFLALDILS